jgi:hypothetical protein
MAEIVCPNCGSSRVARIMYGYPPPSRELEKEMDEERLVLGGCIVTGEDPTHYCNSCGHHWIEKTDNLPDEDRKIAKKGVKKRSSH